MSDDVSLDEFLGAGAECDTAHPAAGTSSRDLLALIALQGVVTRSQERRLLDVDRSLAVVVEVPSGGLDQPDRRPAHQAVLLVRGLPSASHEA